MNRLTLGLLSSGLLLLSGCCCGETWGDGGDKICEHHVEPPLELPDDRPPGPALVIGTADFSGSGSVLIKIQVEDLGEIPGEEADITAWSGNGSAPADASVVPPPDGTLVYESSGDVTLRYYTTHLDRNYEPSEDSYWLFVKVDHDTGAGRDVRYLRYVWVPSATTSPDTSRVFLEY